MLLPRLLLPFLGGTYPFFVLLRFLIELQRWSWVAGIVPVSVRRQPVGRSFKRQRPAFCQVQFLESSIFERVALPLAPLIRPHHKHAHQWLDRYAVIESSQPVIEPPQIILLQIDDRVLAEIALADQDRK